MRKLLSALAAIIACVTLTACENGTSETVASAEATTVVTTSEPQQTVPDETTGASADTTAAETAVTEEASTTAAETAVTEETSAAEETTVTTTAETTIAATAAETDAEEEIIIDDSAEEMSINTQFADMDEFLTSDIFMLGGTTVAADKALSASIFDALKGDFYFEYSDFDGSEPFIFAIKGDMIMTESEADGKSGKMIIRDSKAYTFDHENKIALFLPAEKELTSQYDPEKMGIIPENISKESFIIADVTIGGKAYKFEYGTTSDWAMLYTSDGELYASVKSGDSLDCELYRFSVTSKIPSGTFDIPEDYLQLDLEEIMQNAPPPEEME